MSNKPVCNFNLPVVHLDNEWDHITPKSYDEIEIERRRNLPPGTVKAEFERDGTIISTRTLELLEGGRQELVFLTGWMAVCATNSSQYRFAEHAEDVMSRRLRLAELAGLTSDHRPTTDELRDISVQFLSGSGYLASRYVEQKKARSDRQFETKVRLGRSLGNAAMNLASVPLGDQVQYADAFVAQAMARQASQRTLHNARTLYKVIGSHPSLAQWADPDSDVSVHMRRQAPAHVRAAFMDAQESYIRPEDQLEMSVQ